MGPLLDEAGAVVTKDLENVKELSASFPWSFLVRPTFRNPKRPSVVGRSSKESWWKIRIGNN